MELGLGTVQFGQPYGIARREDAPSAAEAHAVLARAAEAGVRWLDTAPRYGEAEAVLGRTPGGLGAFRVVTKSPSYEGVADPGSHARAALEASRVTLGVDRLDVWLEHRPGALLGDDGPKIWQALEGARAEGRVGRLGASVAAPVELDTLLADYPLEVVQLPANVLDRRHLDPERLADLRARGIEVHVRSAFLQGSLLADPRVSAHVPALADAVRRFHEVCGALDVTPLAAALGVLAASGVDVVLVGVQRVAELEEVLAAVRTPVDLGPFAALACDDPDVIDPSRWGSRP